MAYGARLESVLGATPREFESRILRQVLPSGATVKIKSLRPAHSGKALAFTLAKAVRTRLAHHHRVKATLTLKVKGQLTSKVHFTIH